MNSKKKHPPASEYTRSKDGFIKVIVGSTKQEFLIHKQLICSRIPFFEKCIGSENFKEGRENVVELPEDHPDVFSVIVDCLYNEINDHSENHTQGNLVKAYLLADRFCALDCKNSIMDAIRKKHRGRRFGFEHLEWICSLRLPETSLLWEYYLDQFTFHIRSDENAWADSMKLNLKRPYQQIFERGGTLAAEIFKRVLRKLERSSDWNFGPGDYRECSYHDHSDGSECPESLYY